MIADASWISAEQRDAAAAMAGDASAQLVQLRCTASEDLAQRRMSTRHGVSDADAEITRHMATKMAPWPAATTIDTEGGGLGVDAEPPGAFSDLVRQALEVIRPHGPEHAWHPTRPVVLPD